MNLKKNFFGGIALPCVAVLILLARAALGQVASDYKIAPQDILSIDVFNEKDLTKDQLRVSAKGEISFPLLKTVRVAGKTPAEVEEFIQMLLEKDYLVDPHVIVTVKTYRSRTVEVFGAVVKGGAIDLPGEDKVSILKAIALAGGLTSKANDNKIEHTHNGKTTIYSMRKLKEINDPAKMIYVEPGDVITIPESLL